MSTIKIKQVKSSDGHRKIIKKDIFGNTVIEDY